VTPAAAVTPAALPVACDMAMAQNAGASIADMLRRGDTRKVVDPDARLSERLRTVVDTASQDDLVLVVSAGRAVREAAGHSFAQSLAERLGAGETAEVAMATAVQEAAINAAVHGALGLRFDDAGRGRPDALFDYFEAIQAAPPSAAASAIVLVARARACSVTVTVWDDGGGYQPAHQVSPTDCSGRGMVLIRSLAREVQHLAGGRGCGMTFDLPQSGGPQGAGPASQLLPDSFDVHHHGVLIVDDEPINVDLIRRILRADGYTNIRTASSGAEALALAERWPPDLVLLDVQMPVMDGLEVCRRLRAMPHVATVPIIIQTGAFSAANRTAAFAAGASDFVVKPLHLQELRARTRLHLQNRATIAHLADLQRKLGQELWEARRIQQNLLPTADDIARWERRAGIRLAAEWRSSSMLGGDVWGLHNAPEGPPGLFLVDFSGHGVGAALHATMLCREIHRLWPHSVSPADLLRRLNQELAGAWTDGAFAALCVIEIGEATLRYAAAGAPPTRHLPGAGPWRALPARGLPVGIVADANYTEREIEFTAGHRMLVHTDGLSELRADSGALVEDGVLDHVLAGCVAPGPVAALRRLMRDIGSHATGGLDDDLTAVWLDRM